MFFLSTTHLCARACVLSEPGAFSRVACLESPGTGGVFFAGSLMTRRASGRFLYSFSPCRWYMPRSLAFGFLHQDEPYRSVSSVQVADLLAPPPLLCASPECTVFGVPCGRQFSLRHIAGEKPIQSATNWPRLGVLTWSTRAGPQGFQRTCVPLHKAWMLTVERWGSVGVGLSLCVCSSGNFAMLKSSDHDA